MAEADSAATPWSVRPADYGEFLCRIFDEWVGEDVGRVFVQQFDAALANWVGEPPGICVFSKNCGRAVAVEHNGDMYSCDHYVYPEYRLGNLLNSSIRLDGRFAGSAPLRGGEIGGPSALLPGMPG